MEPSTAQVQCGGLRYHRRHLKPTPFVLAALLPLAFGAVIAVVHSRMGTLSGLIARFAFLICCYLDGPAKSVTVRHDALEVRNSILSVEYTWDLGVFVRVEGHEPIWIGAFSRSQFRWQRLSVGELRANAESLTDTLSATSVRADGRQMKKGYLFLVAVGAIGLLTFKMLASAR